jgi:beta-1,4-mannosyltransferase
MATNDAGAAIPSADPGAFTLPNKKVVFAYPKSDPTNSFAAQFSTALGHCGFDVQEFRWRRRIWPGTILMHWPDEFFGSIDAFGYIKATLKISALLLSKSLLGTRIVWVCHNVKPHDKHAKDTLVQRVFLKAVDGLVFLSVSSRNGLLEAYPILADTPYVVTVHGHYKEAMETPVAARQAVAGRTKLLAFGQVRRYKNFTELAKLVVSLKRDDVVLRISGRARDRSLLEEIARAADGSPSVRLDIRESYLPDAEIEQAIDEADGVVLPYTAILNSGSVLLALSRNTPVLAPRIGSLPELQVDVGENWLMLYDGKIDREAIERFITLLSSRAASSTCDLAGYSWNRVGQDVSRLLHAIHKN